MAQKPLEYKDFKFTVESVDDEAGTFQGYASTFGEVDLGGDIIVKGAFKKTLQEKEYFPLNWVHDTSHPLGIIRGEEDKHGLKIKGELNLDVQSAREKRSLMKQGAIKGLSIGYRAINPGVDKETGARLLKEIQLGEISLCEFPMNPSAQVVSVKNADGEVPPLQYCEHCAEALKEEPASATPSEESQGIKDEPVDDHSLQVKGATEALRELRTSLFSRR